MSEETTRTVKIAGYELTQLNDEEWEGTNAQGVDFHITDDRARTGLEMDEPFCVDLFDAAVEDTDAAYLETVGSETLEGAVRTAMTWELPHPE